MRISDLGLLDSNTVPWLRSHEILEWPDALSGATATWALLFRHIANLVAEPLLAIDSQLASGAFKIGVSTDAHKRYRKWQIRRQNVRPKHH